MSIVMGTIHGDIAEAKRKSLAAISTFNKNKPKVEIVLNEQQKDCFVPSFTTLEQISGDVFITAPVDTKFDGIHVTFQGTVRTYVEKIATSAPTNPRSSAFHTFLRLNQPFEIEQMPENSILKAGVTYRLPFTFVVPEKLLPQACGHEIVDPSIKEAHISLPPSLGDPMMAGDGKTLLDDMAPDNARVSYGIRVFVIKKVAGNDQPKMIVDSQKKIRILPAVPEAPPLNPLGGNEDDYILSTSKELKKSLFGSKTGNLTIQAIQPLPFFLPHPTKSAEAGPTTTMAKLELQFDSYEVDAKPPKLNMLNSRLKIGTFFSSTPLKSIPGKSNAFHYESNRGIYVDTVPLASRCVEGVQWTKVPQRRDSAISLSRVAADSKKSKKRASTPPPDAPIYTASVLIPLALPTTKSFVPTFHSCLISRVYLLDLVISVNNGQTATNQNLHLKLPIQLASIGNPDARPQISAEEAAAIARREADGYFMPRPVGPGNVSPDTSDELSSSPPSTRLPPPPHSLRGARGSVFTPRYGSDPGSGSENEDDGPPEYTFSPLAPVRNHIV